MFILDSLVVSGLRWVLDTVRTAAESEMNDDAALREQLLAAELRRELGEISDADFARLETDLLARIREIRERREGGSGPIVLGEPVEAAPGTQLAVEATLSGEFHGPADRDAPSGTVIEGTVLKSVPAKAPSGTRRRAPPVRPGRGRRSPRRKIRS